MGYAYCPGATPAGPVPNGLNDCCNDQATCYPGLTSGYVGGTLCCTQGVPPSFPCPSASTAGEYICCNGVCNTTTDTNTGYKCCMQGYTSCAGNGIVECCQNFYDGDFGVPQDVEQCNIKAGGDPVCCRDHGTLCGDACCPRSRECAGDSLVGTCCPASKSACGVNGCCDKVTEFCADPPTAQCCKTGEEFCGAGTCCGTTQFCANAATKMCCDDGQTACNNTCCPAGENCVAPDKCCPAGQNLCGAGCCANACVGGVCCGPGQVDCNGACATPPCYP